MPDAIFNGPPPGRAPAAGQRALLVPWLRGRRPADAARRQGNRLLDRFGLHGGRRPAESRAAGDGRRPGQGPRLTAVHARPDQLAGRRRRARRGHRRGRRAGQARGPAGWCLLIGCRSAAQTVLAQTRRPTARPSGSRPGRRPASDGSRERSSRARRDVGRRRLGRRRGAGGRRWPRGDRRSPGAVGQPAFLPVRRPRLLHA